MIVSCLLRFASDRGQRPAFWSALLDSTAPYIGQERLLGFRRGFREEDSLKVSTQQLVGGKGQFCLRFKLDQSSTLSLFSSLEFGETLLQFAAPVPLPRPGRRSPGAAICTT